MLAMLLRFPSSKPYVRRSVHFYADDTQLCTYTKCSSADLDEKKVILFLSDVLRF